jgi:hypothetical protein
VKPPAANSHEKPARGRNKQFAKGIDTVLQGHDAALARLDLRHVPFTSLPGKETGMAEHPAVKNLTVEEVKAGMDAGKIMLVDVREPNELAEESIRSNGSGCIAAGAATRFSRA